MIPIKSTAAGIELNLHVQPGGRRNEILGTHGDALKLRIHAPPVDGKANEMIIEFFSEELGIAKKNIEILRGHTSRQKTLRITGLSEAQLQSFLKNKLSK